MAIGSKRIRSSYLSRGKDLVKNFGNKLVQKTISIKDAVPDALSLLPPTDRKVPSVVDEKLLQDGHGNDRNNQDVEQDRLLIPFLVSEFKEKTGDFSQIILDRLLSKESALAVKTIRKIIKNFPHHGIIDVFSLHPAKDVLASVVALSRLQHVALQSTQLGDNSAGYFGLPSSNNSDTLGDYKNRELKPKERELLADLAHYATFAHCAYGWKFGLLSGGFHLGDKAMLQRKTGIPKRHIMFAHWKSRTHLPAHFVVRDVERKTLVLCIRGTLSPKDILTDLCCTADEFWTHEEELNESLEVAPNGSDMIRNMLRHKHRAKAHHGMLQAARNVAKMTRKVISTELASNPDYKLVIVGHSLGGGVAAVLGSMWRDTFPGVKVYAFGCPCVGPIDFHPYQSDAITCVVGEGDPFSCLSLGHLADASLVLSKLCRDDELRNAILTRLKRGVKQLDETDVRWCRDIMKELETEMQSEKFYPPGRVLFMRGNLFGGIDEVVLREINQESEFRHLRFHPRMFDLSLHIPHRYEVLLARIWNNANEMNDIKNINRRNKRE